MLLELPRSKFPWLLSASVRDGTARGCFTCLVVLGKTSGTQPLPVASLEAKAKAVKLARRPKVCRRNACPEHIQSWSVSVMDR
jgi:hypothetical protein